MVRHQYTLGFTPSKEGVGEKAMFSRSQPSLNQAQWRASTRGFKGAVSKKGATEGLVYHNGIMELVSVKSQVTMKKSPPPHHGATC